jgi:hypothetical protein
MKIIINKKNLKKKKGSYSNIRIKGQAVLDESMNRFSEKLSKEIIKEIIQIISNPKSKENEITGSLHIIENTMNMIILDWELLTNLMMSLIKTTHVTKNSIQDRIMDMHDFICDSFLENQVVSKEKYEGFIIELLDFYENNKNLHWKFVCSIATILVLMIKKDSYLFPLIAVKWFLKNLVSDIERLRHIS